MPGHGLALWDWRPVRIATPRSIREGLEHQMTTTTFAKPRVLHNHHTPTSSQPSCEFAIAPPLRLVIPHWESLMAILPAYPKVQEGVWGREI